VNRAGFRSDQVVLSSFCAQTPKKRHCQPERLSAAAVQLSWRYFMSETNNGEQRKLKLNEWTYRLNGGSPV
jgi:hypothetical protein